MQIKANFILHFSNVHDATATDTADKEISQVSENSENNDFPFYFYNAHFLTN